MKYPNYQIYNNFFDLDLYTISMCLVVLNEFPRAYTKWGFFDRNNTVYPEGFGDALKEQINNFVNVKPNKEELNFIKRKLYYIPEWFINFLESYRYDPSEVKINQDSEGHLNIEIEGLWWRTIFWEQPILETISEMWHYSNGNLDKLSADFVINDSFNKSKVLIDNKIKFAEFGCRRRASFKSHIDVLKGMCEARNTVENGKDFFIGTSDIHIAMIAEKELKTNLSITGTMAHSYVTNIAALYGPLEANSIAMDLWRKNYKGDLGIFLPDGLGWKGFSNNFSKENAKAFDGLRHDSGDEFYFTDKICEKYKELGINPLHKTLIYSNGFTDINKIIEVNKYASNKINCSFGLGGFFTCNFLNKDGNKLFNGLNIVIKSIACKMTEKREYGNTVKIPFDLNKSIGDKETINIYLKLLNETTRL